MSQKFEEIKNQFLYYLEHIQNRIIESNTFNALKEKYQSRSLLHQRFIKYGLVSVIVFLISFIPVYYFYLSSEHWSEFKEKRRLSLDLLKVRNYRSHFSDISEYKMNQNISNIVKRYRDKNYSIKDKGVPSEEKNLKKVIYEIQVDHLNIRQAVQIGMELNDIPPAHLFSLVMRESHIYPKHYDVTFEMSVYFHKIKNSKRSFRVPKNKENKRGRNKKKPRLRGDKRNKKSNTDKGTADKSNVKKRSSGFKFDKSNVKKESPRFKFDKSNVKKESPRFKFDKSNIKKESSGFKFDKSNVKKRSSGFKFDKSNVKKESSGFKFDKEEKLKIKRKSPSKNLKDISEE